MTATDLPEAAGRRLGHSSFTSGLSVNDFAACLQMGMRPVGLVQGFCVMGWQRSYYTTAYGYRLLDSYRCPHGWGYHDAMENPVGYNYEATTLSQVWATGFNAAHQRLIEEAAALGAHGVIGVLDETVPLIGETTREFHLIGTAVVVDGQPHPGAIWSTFLAGAKLAKLFEAGLAPVSVAGAFCEVLVQPGCVTEILEHGRWDATGVVRGGQEVQQLSDAATSVRQLAREHVRATLGADSLHGADLVVHDGGRYHSAVLKGTRVRRVHEVDPLPAPVPTVHLS